MNQISFINKKTELLYNELKQGRYEDKKLYAWLESAFKNLKDNQEAGIKIPKKLWPIEYIQNYEITNLWKYNLPQGWRLVYTIETQEIRVIAIIIEWFDHKGYERRFGY